MNRIVKNALMVTLLASAGMIVPSHAPLQSAVSAVARTSLGDVLDAYGNACDAVAEAAVEGGKIVGRATIAVAGKILTTTPRDVYKFVTHPDTLAVAGVTAAGYAIYKYVNTPASCCTVSYQCSYCTKCMVEDVCYYNNSFCCSPCCKNLYAADQLKAALNETHCVLNETTTELAKLQVALQELSDTTQVS